MEFNENELNQVEEIKKRYPTSQAALMPVLYMIQEKYGWISQEAMQYAARLLDVTEEHVLGVVTFYTMYNTKPVGKYHLQVCTNVSCMLRGAYDLMKSIEHELGIKKGETTSDEIFTITEVECLGSCGTAPMIQINDDFHENLTIESTKTLLSNMKNN
ncbi:MAG: NADH-quinone oxidoreductase subunit NuoE [Bacteroidetes bacterium]|nr:NADH-quinone oxidoreductase subunit NuoE [Bacteroidota bacterium]